MALEGDFEAPVATHETRALALEYNARRSPGDPMMTDSGIVFGPGDIPEVIDEPDYEKSLEASARIFGGDPEDYRQPGMTQAAWEALGTPGAPVPVEAIPLPATRVARNQIEDAANQHFTARFFMKLADKPECCLESLGEATEALAVLERDLFRKASDALDEAWRVASQQSNGSLLLQVACAYRELAQAAS